jgi:hypothetical protein
MGLKEWCIVSSVKAVDGKPQFNVIIRKRHPGYWLAGCRGLLAKVLG